MKPNKTWTPSIHPARTLANRWADDPTRSAGMARYVLISKLANSRNVLLRAARDHGDDGRDEPLRAAALHLADCLRRIERLDLSLDEVRGIEGEAGAGYFSTFDALITSDDEAFRFKGRNRRPPRARGRGLKQVRLTALVLCGPEVRPASRQRDANGGSAF